MIAATGSIPDMSSALSSVLDRYRGSEPAKARKAGRPRKRTADYLRALMWTHRALVSWYVQAHGHAPASDRVLYTAYFARRFALAGERPSKAEAQDFQRSLKTLQNELAEARRLERTNPEKGAIYGKEGALQ